MSSSSRCKEWRRELMRQGFKFTKTGGGHWRITHARMRIPVFAADTPSDRRSLMNTEALIRRLMREANKSETG